MTKTKKMLMPDQNLLRNHLYNTFVLHPMTEQKEKINDIEVEVHHEKMIIQKTTIHKTDIALQLEIDLEMTRVLLLIKTLDHDMTTINETCDLISLLIDPLTNHLIDVILVTDIDHAHIQEIITRHSFSFRPPSRPRDSRYSRSRPYSSTRNKPDTIQPQTQNDPINFEVHMYHPTEMTNAVPPTIWFYSKYTHTPSIQIQRDYPSRLEISFLFLIPEKYLTP